MRTFLFWHRPLAETPPADYERALLAYHQSLDGMVSPGFVGSATARLDAVPWLGGEPGYEDWYLVDSSAALDPLNEAGVAPERWERHAAVARQMAVGHGGLYAHLWGASAPGAAVQGLWLTRPRGIDFEAPLRALYDATPGVIGCWRKQLVLGPAPEFLFLSADATAPPLPEGWHLRAIARTPLWLA